MVSTKALAVTGVLALAGAAQEQVDVEPQGQVTGYVLGPLGDPVPAAEVWVQGWLGEVLLRTRSDGEGFFVVRGLEAGSGLVIRATADGLNAGSEYAVPRLGDEPAQPAVIRLYEGATVAGRVVDDQGRPIAGATVVGCTSGRSFTASYEANEVVTDAEGRFLLERLAAGQIWISVWQDGFVPSVRRLRCVDHATVEIPMEPGDGRRLRVVAKGVPEGYPHPIEVRYRGYSDALPLRSMRRGLLDEEHVFVSPGFPSGANFRYVKVSSVGLVFDPGSQDTGARSSELVFTALAPAQGEATPDRTVTLRVVDPEGTPLASERVYVWAYRRNVRARGTTDEDGEVSVTAGWSPLDELQVRLEDSDYHLTPTDRESRLSLSHELSMWRGTVEELTGKELVAHRGHSLSVDVRAPDGDSAVRGAYVRLVVANQQLGGSIDAGTTDRQGRVVWRGLPFDPSQIDVHVTTYRLVGSSLAGPVRSPEARRIVTLPGGIIEGSVRDRAGQPVGAVAVWLRTWDFENGGQRDGSVVETRTDSQGRFRHLGVLDGGYWLQVMGDEREEISRYEPFEVQAGDTIRRELEIPTERRPGRR